MPTCTVPESESLDCPSLTVQVTVHVPAFDVPQLTVQELPLALKLKLEGLLMLQLYDSLPFPPVTDALKTVLVTIEN
jgi:hypothetical protein